MTSEKQVQANQRNARKSTGPKTSEGKAAARYNATKHGLLAEEVLIPGEDEAHLADLGERLRDELQPMGELENMLMDRIIAAYWRLRRVGRVEASIFAWERYRELAERTRKEALSYNKQVQEEKINNLLGPGRPQIEDKKELRELLVRTNELEEMQDGETTTLGRTFVRDADETNAFSKLSRYETTLERSLYKALHELQRLQAARRAEGNVAPPVAVDVEVSGIPGEEL
jgi:hypothetical protein